MLQLHQVLANTALLVLLLLAIWGLLAALLNRSVGGGYRSTYILTLGLFAAQDVVGIIIFVSGRRPASMLHLLYGVVPFIALIGGLTYSANTTHRKESLILGVVALFTFGLVIRATMTGA